MRRFYRVGVEMLHQAPRQPVEVAGEGAGREGDMAAGFGLFERDRGRNLIRGGQRPGRQEGVVFALMTRVGTAMDFSRGFDDTLSQ
jgi:hypothetical protein